MAQCSSRLSYHQVLLSPLEVPGSDGCEFGAAEPTTQAGIGKPRMRAGEPPPIEG